MVSKNTAMTLLVAVVVLIVVVGLFLGPIPQPLSYHHFVDQRNWLGIPNASNVLSNVLFAVAGFWGLFVLFYPGKVFFVDNRERWLWMGVSIGLILTAVGSSYYHLEPSNSRLVWDRLPMTIVFMSLVAALIAERIHIILGIGLWPLLLGIGFYSVLSWQHGELLGEGDLRFYLGVQVFAILVTFVMLFVPSPYSRSGDLSLVIFCYLLAVIFERLDYQIFALSHHLVSGHTLKHLLAATAGMWLIFMIWKREKRII